MNEISVLVDSEVGAVREPLHRTRECAAGGLLVILSGYVTDSSGISIRGIVIRCDLRRQILRLSARLT